jgi:hypothetical protein
VLDFKLLGSIKKIFVRFKPGIPKRYLLLVVALLWFAAGAILIYRGEMMLQGSYPALLFLLISIAGGVLMFFLVFLKLSLRLIKRITSLEILKPCIFSFFDVRGYIMMVVMIAMGILLRRSGILSLDLLAYFYFMMSIPLMISSVRFFIAWKKYPQIVVP